jgi:hypothetical protein
MINFVMNDTFLYQDDSNTVKYAVDKPYGYFVWMRSISLIIIKNIELTWW